MKKILFLLIAILFSIASYAQTPVPPGPISGTWTLDGSPYLIQGETTIDSGTILTIEPGVLVEWQGSYTMHVQGQILAVGTETDSITFTAADTLTGWKSVRFDSTPVGNDTSRFAYCVFKYGRVYGEYPDNCGGAIGARNYDKFVIDHCLFYRNKAVVVNLHDPGGGAIALWTSSPLIRNCTFSNNVCLFGGAIFCYLESHPLIKNNLFTDNTAYNLGGAIMCWVDSDPLIYHNLFYDNIAQIDGGAIELHVNCSPIIINNTIAYNVADGIGGGIYLYDGCSPHIQNTILWGNTADEGNQVYIYTDNCVPNFYYSDIQGGQDSIGGVPVTGEYRFCIDSLPLFEDPQTGDYHLTANSPCIDAGDPSIVDPDGTTSDIGAYYFDQRVITALDATGIMSNSFTANWQAATDALGYLLDVAFDENFTNFVTGYHNLNAGNTLSYLVEGLEPSTTYYYRVRANYFWGRSGYSNSISTETPVNIDENNDNELNLITVYPNPVNELSNIRYQISDIRYVTLAVYDIHGQEICVLVNKTQAAGEYTARFDVSDLPAGIYFIRLQIGDAVITKKIIKMK